MTNIQTQIQDFVPVVGGQIFFEAAGDPSKQALLFIHAGVADRRMWEAQVEHFAPQYHVIRYDTRGYGKTVAREDAEFANRADAMAVLDHLDIPHAVCIGCSRGGMIAMDLALDMPKRVRALVMVASAPGGFDYPRPDTELTRFIGGIIAQMGAAEAAKDFAKLATLDVRLWGDGPAQPEGRMAAPVRERMHAMCLDHYANWTTDGKPHELRSPAIGRLGAITIPVLIVEGEFDLPSLSAAAETMRHGIPHAEHVIVHGAAHLPSMEQPEVFNAALDEFLQRHGLS